jgi:hypothetical protein
MGDTLIFATLYTILMMIVSSIYYFMGQRKGIEATVNIIATIDPLFIAKIKPKLQELIDGTETDS